MKNIIPYGKQDINEDDINNVVNVLKSDFLTQGPTIQVFENRIQKIPTSVLNDVMLDIIAATPPPSLKGKYIRIKYVQQLASYGPSFAFFCWPGALLLPLLLNDLSLA